MAGPCRSGWFLAMVWHGRRRQPAMDDLATVVERQDRFLHDASHELRTPITIARGHLDVLQAEQGNSHELEVAQDELRCLMFRDVGGGESATRALQGRTSSERRNGKVCVSPRPS